MSSEPSSASRARRAFWTTLGDALGSRNLWLVIAGIEIALTLLSQVPGDVRRPTLNILAGAISSAALLAVIWLGWVLLISRLSGVLRVVAATPIVVVAGVVRGLTLQWLLVEWGMSEPGLGGFQYRTLASVLVVTLGATTGALLKVAVDGHRQRLEDLAAEQERLALILEEAEAQVLIDQSGTLQEVSEYLTEQLATVKGSSPLLAIDSLETLVSSIVRPLSHELAATNPTWKPPEPSRSQSTLDRSRVWGSIASVGFIDPAGPAAFVLIVTPASIAVAGFKPALFLHFVVGALVFVGLWALRALAPRLGASQSLPIRLAITGAALMAACIPAAIATFFLSGPVSGFVNAIYIVVLIPLVALLWSFIRSARLQRREIDEAMTQVVEQTRWWISRTRMAGWWQRATMARALHGPIQTAIHAAAQRLRTALEHGDASDTLVQSALDGIRISLPTLIANDSVGRQVDDDLQVLVATWQPLASITVTLDHEAQDRLQRDVICGEICADIIGEAVSNAVRHGGARHIQADVQLATAEVLSIVVTDDGSGWDRSPVVEGQQQGLGSVQLETCALTWAYRRDGTWNHLLVELPIL